MRLAVISLLFFTFSCTSDSKEVSKEELSEITNSQEQSELTSDNIKKSGEKSLVINTEAFDKLDALTEYTIRLGKTIKKIEDLNDYRDDFSIKYEELKFSAEQHDSESGSLMIEYIDQLMPLKDMTFDASTMEDFNKNLKKMKVYLGDFYKYFSKEDSDQ
ncbi:MAG: hypothetical protein ABF242_04860 [Flavobacteriales bacterium]